MRDLPPDLPETGRWAALYRWLNQLKACVYSLRPLLSENTLTGSTPHGTFRNSAAPSSGKGDGNIPEIDQWDPRRDYSQNDLSFGDTDPELDDGTQAGLYQAINDVAGGVGNPHPSVDTTNWRMVARGHWSRFTMRSGSTRIRFDIAGPNITVYNDSSDETAGSVQIDLNDIPIGAGNKVIKIREWPVCSDSASRYALFLSSDSYT